MLDPNDPFLEQTIRNIIQQEARDGAQGGLIRQLQGLSAASSLTLTPLNSWIGTVHYTRANGIVHVWSGDNFNAQAPATNAVCAQLPAGYRPGTSIRLPMTYWKGSSGAYLTGSCRVDTAGNIVLLGVNDNLDLATATSHGFSVSFYAEN